MTFQLHHGDCLEVLRGMDDNSVDSIVTDPPYGLSFMGKGWDYDVPSEAIWRECLRVLKPGGHLLAFAGTRTQHRMAVRIEDAGFEIRDMIAWVYGSGFPKSLDVSKAIDQAGGASPVEQASMLRQRREAAGLTREQVAEAVGCTVSSVRDWEEGRARAIGAPTEFIVPSKDYRAKLADILGYSADERRLIGASADRRGDGTVYGVGHSGEIRAGGFTDAARQWQGWGTALKPALEPITVARKPLAGTVAANVLAHGTGALNIDGCRVPTEDNLGGGAYAKNPSQRDEMWGAEAGNSWVRGGAGEFVQPPGRWPANLIHDGSEEVLATFPDAPGQSGAVTGNEPTGNGFSGVVYGHGGKAQRPPSTPRNDAGSSARFFYCAKASRADRNEGIGGSDKPAVNYGAVPSDWENANWKTRNGNHHPTVKPTDLMAYLCRLVTPPHGVVLDPFMGSGSTGKACMREGFQFIGIEREAEFLDIARSRIEHALRQPKQHSFDLEVASE